MFCFLSHEVHHEDHAAAVVFQGSLCAVFLGIICFLMYFFTIVEVQSSRRAIFEHSLSTHTFQVQFQHSHFKYLRLQPKRYIVNRIIIQPSHFIKKHFFFIKNSSKTREFCGITLAALEQRRQASHMEAGDGIPWGWDSPRKSV